MGALYDTIGINYSKARRTDPRIAEAIHFHLDSAETVLNVGAGTGSYEPPHLKVTAVEPSAVMIDQRPPSNAFVVQASAEELPFRDKSFDAALAILTVHHWADLRKGLAEMRRATRGKIVILTFDPLNADFWLLDYLPSIEAADRKQMPCLSDFENALGPVDRIEVPIPHDCVDGMLCAYWRRPAAYLDPEIRGAISTFSKIGNLEEPLARLEDDIRSGRWERKYRWLLEKDALDLGYYLVVTR